jgi:hypothetical protein
MQTQLSTYSRRPLFHSKYIFLLLTLTCQSFIFCPSCSSLSVDKNPTAVDLTRRLALRDRQTVSELGGREGGGDKKLIGKLDSSSKVQKIPL